MLGPLGARSWIGSLLGFDIGPQPGDGPWCRLPCGQGTADVLKGFALIPWNVVVRRLTGWKLLTQQIGRDVFVLLLGLLEQSPGGRIITILAEGEQRFMVSPCSRSFVRVLFEKMSQILVALEEEQKAGQGVADALIIVGVQPEHLKQVRHGLFPTTGSPESMSQSQPGAHVRPGSEKTPKMAGLLSKEVWTQCPLSRRHALLVQMKGLLAGGGVLGQKDIGIRAVGTDGEGFFRQIELAPFIWLLKGLVHDLLCLIERRIPPCTAEAPPHLAFQRAPVGNVRPAWRAGLLRLSIRFRFFLGHRESPVMRITSPRIFYQS